MHLFALKRIQNLHDIKIEGALSSQVRPSWIWRSRRHFLCIQILEYVCALWMRQNRTSRSDGPWKPCRWNFRLAFAGDVANSRYYIAKVHIASMTTPYGLLAILLCKEFCKKNPKSVLFLCNAQIFKTVQWEEDEDLTHEFLTGNAAWL